MSSNADDPKADQTASHRLWFRLVVVYLMIPLILFVCGGDLGWWQAWLYSMLFLVAGIGGRMWAERRHPGLTAERQDMEKAQSAKAWDKVLAPLMALSVSFPLVIVAGLDHRFGWSPIFPWWLIVIGFLFISLGYVFAAWALIENRFFSSLVRIQVDRGHAVCVSGPYRLVRHPGYAGTMLALPGMVLALSTTWTLIRVAGLSRLCTTCPLSIDSGGLLKRRGCVLFPWTPWNSLIVASRRVLWALALISWRMGEPGWGRRRILLTAGLMGRACWILASDVP
jgi:protein-S-isoprenylcysteine O-methyltransferase Ste14